MSGIPSWNERPNPLEPEEEPKPPDNRYLDQEPATIEELRQIAAKGTRGAMECLVKLIHDTEARPQDKLRAADLLLEIAHGRDKTILRTETEEISAVQKITELFEKGQQVELPAPMDSSD